jgi:divalent metal cation (Fe/Co/Zn/Cd) transporter
MGSYTLADADLVAQHDASNAGLDKDQATQIVKCTTYFASMMCVVIAVVKVSIYFATKQDVVRTSALDSLGDLMANCITLYTGVRMRQIDLKRYPAGQGKFQNIGCLVFSTLMFSLMFGNALGNLESLVESEDDVGFKAVSRFFYMNKYGDLNTGDFKKWSDEVAYDDAEDEYQWSEGVDNVDNFLKKYYMQHGNDYEKEFAVKDENYPSVVKRGWLVKEVAQYESDAKKAEDLWTQNTFLGACATYKLCLWMYCIWYAIPKSGSSVLKALANDKRNDCVGTYSVIIATTLAYMFRRTLPISADKVDPLVSLFLSAFIMYSWSTLMVEHMTILSMEAGSDEFCEGVREVIEAAVQNSPCEINKPDDIKIYHSSEKHTIEVHLAIRDPSTAFGEIATFCKSLRKKLQPLPDVENVVLHTTLTRGGGGDVR